jgi:galactokinase
LFTTVRLAPRADQRVRASSDSYPDDGGLVEYRLGGEVRRRAWVDYVQGITSVLRATGRAVEGFDLSIASSIPPGSGLSSSAALGVALLRALRSAYGLKLGDLEVAHLARRSENEFVGAQVGIMDPLACALTRPGEALFIDTRTLAIERLALPPELELAVLHSGVSHDHARGDYNRRRLECEEAARRLGVKELRDVPAARVEQLGHLPEPLGRRARHVIRENERVLSAVRALREKAFGFAAGRL